GGARAAGGDVAEQAVQVAGGFGVDDDEVGACGADGLDPLLGAADHEVGFEGQRADVGAGSGDEHGAHGDVGDEVAVHDVHLEAIGAGGDGGPEITLQAAEVGREDGGDEVGGAGAHAASCSI